MSLKKYKVRCSSLGVICAKKGFAKTGMSKVQEEVKAIIYERRREIRSKYLTKGNVAEVDCVDQLNAMYGLEIEKNEKHFSNEWIEGTPDFIEPAFCRDIKNSYDETTFPLFDEELDHNYLWQMKGYLWLLGMTKGSVDYFLNDLSDELVEKEAWNEVRRLGLSELDMELFDKTKALYTFSDLPIELRYKNFPVELTDADIIVIKTNVEKANEYGNMLLEKYRLKFETK